MAKEIKERRMKSLNELFGESNETEGKASQQNTIPDECQNVSLDMAIIELPVNLCHPYHNHKFKTKRGDYDGLVKSIMVHGITNPIIVRPYQGEYEIIAGHRRHQASIDSGKTTIPAIVRELSDNEAWVIVSETNIQQSSLNDLSHSEKAEIISDYHSALKAQGKRTDLINEVRNLMESAENKDLDTFSPVGEKSDSTKKTGSIFKLSGRTVTRYLRIYLLTDEIKGFIDKEEVSIRAAVELSYISKENQAYLAYNLNHSKYKVDLKKAELMRDYEKNKQLNEVTILEILSGNAQGKEKKEPIIKGFKPMPKVYNRYFNSDYTQQDIETIIDKALKLYFKQEQPL